MEYGKVFERAWKITWRHRILWLFGFLASLLSRGGNGGQGGVNYRLSDWSMQAPEWAQWSIAVVVLLLVLLLLVVVAVLSTIGRGALIDGVRQAEEEGDSVSGGNAWRAGVSRFWSLLGIGVLNALALGVLIVPVILGVVGAVMALDRSDFEPVGILAVVGGACVCAVPLFAVGAALSLLREFADRACVLEELSAVQAIARGWAVLRANVGPALIVGAILFVINLIFGGLVFGGAVSLGVPAASWLPGAACAGRAAVGVCCLGLISLAITLVVGAVLQTFTSSLWTLAYRELTAPDPETELVL